MDAVDVLIHILAETDGPITRSQILSAPDWADRPDRILVNAARDAQDSGLIQQLNYGTYELTDAGRVHAAALA